KLEAVADAQVKAKGRITRPTALLIDKSGSMEVAIELGKRIGALVSAVCEAGLYVYAFDTVAYPIEAAGTELAGREAARKASPAGVGADVFQFSGDYYALPNLIPMLARPSKLDLLMEILEYPLPQRKPA